MKDLKRMGLELPGVAMAIVHTWFGVVLFMFLALALPVSGWWTAVRDVFVVFWGLLYLAETTVALLGLLTNKWILYSTDDRVHLKYGLLYGATIPLHVVMTWINWKTREEMGFG